MKKVLVIGDTILDHYIFGSVDRVNPEAPHSVVLDYEKEEFRLGGACNVAHNIKTLLGNLVSVHYAGATSEHIQEMLTDVGIASFPNVTHNESQILLKTRFVCENHHILRLDRNKLYDFSNSFYDQIMKKISEESYDLIVVSDYNKGTLTSFLSKVLFETDVPMFIDIKSGLNLPHFNSKYPKKENVILKCNKKEFRTEINTTHIHAVKAVIETRGSEGYIIHDSSSYAYKSESLDKNTNPVDVVGAGDSFLAGMAYTFIKSKSLDPQKLAASGDAVARMKIKHFGTHAVKI